MTKQQRPYKNSSEHSTGQSEFGKKEETPEMKEAAKLTHEAIEEWHDKCRLLSPKVISVKAHPSDPSAVIVKLVMPLRSLHITFTTENISNDPNNQMPQM